MAIGNFTGSNVKRLKLNLLATFLRTTNKYFVTSNNKKYEEINDIIEQVVALEVPRSYIVLTCSFVSSNSLSFQDLHVRFVG